MTSFPRYRPSEGEGGLATIVRPACFAARAAHPSCGAGRPGGPVAVLGTPVVVAEPGRTATLSVRVGNRTRQVDDLRIEVLGPASAWSTVTPEVVGLLPGEEVDVTVLLTPPPSCDRSVDGIPFAVSVASMAPPHDAAMDVGVLRVVDAGRPAVGLRLLPG